MNTAALYRALDFEYRHPPVMHPVEGGPRRRPAGHSCQPAVLEQRRRTAQLHRFLEENTFTDSTASATAVPTVSASATATLKPTGADFSESESGCSERKRQQPTAAPSRLSQLAAVVRESRRQPCVQGADLDRALAGQHPLHDTARRLLERVKAENKLLHLPVGRRVGSSAASAAGRSLAPGGRRGLLGSARDGGDERERRKRMFSILYK